MFENIIGQSVVVERLQHELISDTLPGAMLFFGHPYCGKLSSALELSRALTCLKSADWSCSCPECEKQRRLMHPNVIFIGRRYFIEEIAACGDVLLRKPSTATQYLFLRSIRKLTRRFDPLIWDGNENKLKGLKNEIDRLEQICENMFPVLPDKEDALKKEITAATEGAQKIIKSFKQDIISIDRIRNLTNWVHTTGYPKIIILEEAESMSEGAKNALLKSLEEPPSQVYFILITSKKEEIIPTIRSRTRLYSFKERSYDDNRKVLGKIFREESGRFSDLREFFLAWKGINVTGLKNDAKQWIDTVLQNEDNMDIYELLSNIKDQSHFHPFLEELCLACKLLLHNNYSVNPEKVYSFSTLINKAMQKYELYHQNHTLLLEELFYQMKETR